jgi:hypothetical protein
VITPLLEDVEKIFTRVDFHFGVVKFLNGGSRPQIVDYHKEVAWEDVLLLALADKLIPLMGRVLDGHQIMSLCRLLRTPLQGWLKRIEKTMPNSCEDFAVDITENGKELVAMWTGADGFYDLRNPGKAITEITWMPEEAHLYNVAMLHHRMQRAVSRYLTDKNAHHAATAQVEQFTSALEQSGHLRNDFGDDPAGHVRDGSPTVESGDNPAGTAG